LGKTIHVSDEVWEKLTLLKIKKKKKTLNEVIEELLKTQQT